eukprot:16998-Pyramimonas_sp.AAC.1
MGVTSRVVLRGLAQAVHVHLQGGQSNHSEGGDRRGITGGVNRRRGEFVICTFYFLLCNSPARTSAPRTAAPSTPAASAGGRGGWPPPGPRRARSPPPPCASCPRRPAGGPPVEPASAKEAERGGRDDQAVHMDAKGVHMDVKGVHMDA